MGMILRIASSRIVGQGDIVGRSGYFSLNLSANSVMRGRLDARRTLKSLVADLREKKEGRYLRREFSYSKFQQTMILPDDVDKEKISAQVENGVLNIDLPKFSEQEKEKAKRFIDVK